MYAGTATLVLLICIFSLFGRSLSENNPTCSESEKPCKQTEDIDREVELGYSVNACPGVKTDMVIKNVKLTPQPLKPGANMVVTFTLDVKKTITSGNLDLKVYTFGILMFKKDVPLKDLITLPLNPGEHVLTITKKIPSAAPKIEFKAEMEIKDQAGRVGCIIVNSKIS